MAVATRAIIEGTVQAVSTRSGTNDKGPWTMTEVLVIGENSLAMGTLDKGLGAPKIGDKVRAQIEVGVYKGDDSVRIMAWL